MSGRSAACSPRRVASRHATPRHTTCHIHSEVIDVWSLGCVLAELYTGYVLLQNDSVVTMLARMIGILGAVPPPMLARGRDVPKYVICLPCA